VSIDTTEYLVL